MSCLLLFCVVSTKMQSVVMHFTLSCLLFIVTIILNHVKLCFTTQCITIVYSFRCYLARRNYRDQASWNRCRSTIVLPQNRGSQFLWLQTSTMPILKCRSTNLSSRYFILLLTCRWKERRYVVMYNSISHYTSLTITKSVLLRFLKISVMALKASITKSYTVFRLNWDSS